MSKLAKSLHDPVSILHLEDNALDGDLVREYLAADGLGCTVTRVWNKSGFEAALRDASFHLILADHQLPDFDGEAALEIARTLTPAIPFIFVSGTLGEDVAVEALKRGATDYVVKQRLDRLPAVVRRAINEAAERAERQRAESALRASEASFETLVDAMPQLCWVTDSEGEPTWFNRRWYDYTGLDAARVAAGAHAQVHDPAFAGEVVRRWRQSVETGEPFEMVSPLRGSDGQYRRFLTRANPVKDEDGHVVRWLGTSTDVSAQYQAEDALRRLNETLEQRVVEAIAQREAMLGRLYESQRLETIGQLTGGVAHDFNNLLTPIIGSLDLIRNRISPEDRSQRLLGAALQAAERARMLVQRLLAFARRQVLEPRAVDVQALVEDMADLVIRSIGPHVTLEISPASGLPAARVDPNQLELALLNLAVNARDAMPDGGVLSISVDERDVGPGAPEELRHGRYVRISVVDTGTGMDDAVLRRSIEPFFSTKGVGRGTGLGLSMVHGLAAQSGGALLLSSVPGEGTRAEIWLPAANGQPQREDQPRDRAVAGRTATILLVDDEPLVRAATAEMLSDLGHSVIEVSSGAQALDALAEGAAVDLVITDYLMPVQNGANLAREVRARWPTLPLLLATGYASLAGHAMADLPLLPKPFHQAELGATIDRLLAQRGATEVTNK